MFTTRHTPAFERVLTAIRLEEPDRVPLAEVWVDSEVKDAYLGFPVRSLEDDVNFWQTAGYDFIALDSDLYATPQIQRNLVKQVTNLSIVLGSHQIKRNWVDTKAGVVNDREDVRRFSWPKADDIDYSQFKDVSSHLPSDMKVLVTFGHVFTAAWQLMGFEAFCLALYDDFQFVSDIICRLGEETMRLMDRVLSYDSVGIMCFADDVAYKSGPMISPQFLRRLFFPWLRRAASICHEAGRPILYHSDGDLDEILPDIVASGVDGIMGIEPKCMDIAIVKRKYGDNLALMGNVDLGYTLTRGTEDDVKMEVKKIIHDVGPGGGLLVGSSNSITNYVPLRNYKALLEAVVEYGSYPISV